MFEFYDRNLHIYVGDYNPNMLPSFRLRKFPGFPLLLQPSHSNVWKSFSKLREKSIFLAFKITLSRSFTNWVQCPSVIHAKTEITWNYDTNQYPLHHTLITANVNCDVNVKVNVLVQDLRTHTHCLHTHSHHQSTSADLG